MARRPDVLILHAPGTNRDQEAAWAVEQAGGHPEIVHINQLRAGERHLTDYAMVILPGGFSYGDALGAGRRWALGLTAYVQDALATFIADGRPVLGICNGFQALVKAGLLPGWSEKETPATLTHNASGRFECRWVTLLPEPNSRCLFTRDLTEPILCPVAHGEGRFVARSPEVVRQLEREGQVVLRYGRPDGTLANGAYPANPNGSIADIAGICNREGNVLGLMPHPEDAIWRHQLPQWTRGNQKPLGLTLFENAIRS